MQHCYACHSHSAKRSLGNLFLDSRQAMMQGGQGGATLMPGDPDHSRLIEAVRYVQADLQMPPKANCPRPPVADLPPG